MKFLKLINNSSSSAKKLTTVKEVWIHDFDDFTSPFTGWFLFWLKGYIKYSRQCFIGYPNTSNFVKNSSRQKYSVVCRIINSLVGVWISRWDTISLVLVHYIKHVRLRPCLTTFPNTEKRMREVKIRRATMYFWRTERWLGNVVKHCLEYLIYTLFFI